VLEEREVARKEMQKAKTRRTLEGAAEERGRAAAPAHATSDRAHALETIQRGRTAKTLAATRRSAPR